MRQKTNDGCTLCYPDEVGFAFNPCLLTMKCNGLKSMDIYMACGGTSLTYSVEANNGCVYADVRDYIQGFFDATEYKVNYTGIISKTNQGKVVDFIVGYTDSTGTHETFSTFSTFYVWGAMVYGEQYNGFRRLKMFAGYPFTFGFYHGAEWAALILYDSKNNLITQMGVKDKGIYNINCTDFAKFDDIVVIDSTGTLETVTFDNTFDSTFKIKSNGDKETNVMYIEIDKSVHYGKHVYLRWINRHGFYCYYLFKAGAESRVATADGEFMRNNLIAWDSSYGMSAAGTGRRQQYNREDTIELCAPLVDSDTFDFLQDLTTSPVVDRWMGDDVWRSVTIKAGTYTKSTDDLQDFVCNMVLEETPIQSL